MIRILFISLFLISCKGSASNTADLSVLTYDVQIENEAVDSLLIGIEDKIHVAFVQSLMGKDITQLSELTTDLAQLNEVRSQNIITYWRAYLQFYKAIYYISKEDAENSEIEVDKGIDWLDGMDNKNSEDYALLAMLQGFTIQFKGARAMFLAGTISDNLERAIALDGTNLRAYFVSGSNDFYTPEKYGGGQKVEGYLLKAISLQAQKVKNDVLPSWGKEEAYEMLIKFYIGKENWEMAKEYFQKGIGEFAESYRINQLASQLIGK